MRYLAIILILSSAALARQTWIVGGKGTGAGASTNNGGGYATTGSGVTATWLNAQGTNGGPVTSDANVSYDHTGGAAERLFTKGGIGIGVNVGTYLRVTAGTNITPGIYEITNVIDNDNIACSGIAATGDNSDSTIYVGGALPNPGDVPDSDDFGVGQRITSGAQAKIWIANNGSDYNTTDESASVLYINVAGGSAAPVVWEGHVADIADDTGDGGVVVFDAGSSLTNVLKCAVGGAIYHVFKNIYFTRATGDGVSGAGIDDVVVFKNCAFVNNAGHGVYLDNACTFIGCLFDSNGGDGLLMDDNGVFIGCIFQGNSGNGLQVQAGAVVYAIVSCNNGNMPQIYLDGARQFVANCSIDGDNQAFSQGIFNTRTSVYYNALLNNILFDCNYGIATDASINELAIDHNNIFNNNITNVEAGTWFAPSADATPNLRGSYTSAADPYEDSANRDYDVTTAVQATGIDAYYTKKFWDDFNGGAGDNPPSPLTGLSYMDPGALQKEMTGAGGTGGLQQTSSLGGALQE